MPKGRKTRIPKAARDGRSKWGHAEPVLRPSMNPTEFGWWPTTPRPMTGLWATLTPEERQRILDSKDDV